MSVTVYDVQAEALRLLEEAKKSQGSLQEARAARLLQLAHGYAHLASTMDSTIRLNGNISE